MKNLDVKLHREEEDATLEVEGLYNQIYYTQDT